MKGVELRCEQGRLTVTLSGWRRLVAVQRGFSVPLSAVVAVEADAAPRARVGVGARRRSSRAPSTGLFRYGAYPGAPGWAFWAIDSGSRSVVVELDAGRYRYLVVEVDDPAATVAEIRHASRVAKLAAPQEPGYDSVKSGRVEH